MLLFGTVVNIGIVTVKCKILFMLTYFVLDSLINVQFIFVFSTLLWHRINIVKFVWIYVYAFIVVKSLFKNCHIG